MCKGEWQGREVIGMKVTWDKRYITLAPVCTLLGLAFRLYDPEACSAARRTWASPARWCRTTIPAWTPAAAISR